MFVFFRAEDGIRDLVRSRGLGDVYKRQGLVHTNIREERGLKAFHQRLVSDVIGREMRENAGFHVSFVVEMYITSPPGDTAVNKRGVRPKVHDIDTVSYTHLTLPTIYSV